MKSKFLLTTVALLSAGTLGAQTPAPVIVQAVQPPAAAAAPLVAAPEAEAQAVQAALKLLQEVKAANDAILSRQAATLQQLEEIEKAAEQIKVYTKRG